MPLRRIRAPEIDFSAVRAELDLPAQFPDDVVAEALRAAASPVPPRRDATDIELVTVDPPGSRDLDQAVHIAVSGGGYLVTYAIADVAVFAPIDGPLGRESRRRGETMYSPDTRTPLYPPELSEGAASLLPGQVRPALLWQIDLDRSGRPTTVDVRRALVRSRAQLDYPGLQAHVEAGTAPAAVRLLPEVGRLRQQLARDRAAINLNLPEQEVVRDAAGSWSLELRVPLPVEGYNAEISLLTGMCAARLMLDGGVGLLRTLPPADGPTVAGLREVARALSIDWPEGATPGDVACAVDPGTPAGEAFLSSAASLLRGAGYTAFDGSLPAQPGHAGVGAPYAHVTAPLRRLADRFAGEVCLARCAGTEIPSDVRHMLPELPELMSGADHRAHELERAVVDLTEATVLAGRVGETFGAVVVESGPRRNLVTLADLPVRAVCNGTGLSLGQRLTVRLIQADPATRAVRFAVAD